MNEIIKSNRLKLNEIDDKILKLLVERKAISKAVIEEKLNQNLPINNFEREDEIINRLDRLSAGEISRETIELLFKRIFDESKTGFLKEENAVNTVIEAIKSTSPLVIAGPCAVESKEQINEIAKELSGQGIKFLRGGGYKPRTSPNTFQGLGAKGVRLLKEAAFNNDMFAVTEIMSVPQLKYLYDYIDVIQIGSRMMTAFSFLEEIGRVTAIDKKPIILKRGLYSTINEFLFASEYLTKHGNDNIILCLRGIRTFEQIDSEMRFTPDLAHILELKEKSKFKIIFDPSHSAGKREYVIPLAKSALSLGADGVIIEAHNKPDTALVDGRQTIESKLIKNLI
jgi:3-deoxy-7-phosphoheptulonate synthase/chorismate mutase